MNRLSLLSILLFVNLNSFCQEDIKTQLVANFHKVSSIDPQQTDYSDLEDLGKSIGNSRIVFLGEQDHGDAPTFLAKTRIIKYLHEKMGFDVLVFESDFWGLNNVWENRLNDTFSISQIRFNTYSIWARCEQTQQLYSYIDQALKTNDPLIVSGLDCRHSSDYSKRNYMNALTAFSKSQNSFASDTTSLTAFLNITNELIKKEYRIKSTKEQQSFFTGYLDKVTPSISDAFWKQELINLKGFALNSWAKDPYTTTARDVSMANNLLWLYHEKYQGKKIIVWAHSAHNAKNIGTVPHENSTSMGNEVFKSLKDSIYDLGFSSLTGKAGRINFDRKYTVQKAKANSFETWVSALNYEYGFVNFRSLNNTTSFYMKGLGNIRADKVDWTKIFDGVFYIKNMYPCDKTN